jgi:hypothetical protein
MIRNNPIPWTRRLRRNKCQWPNPEASTGKFYRKMGRDSSCWEAIGPARETFIQIADEIKYHLEKASEPVPQAVTWTIYMIGKTKNTAEPMILFCCRESASRKQVRTTVEESGILQRYPGLRVGDASRPPDFDQLVQLAGETSESLSRGSYAKPKSLEFRCGPDNVLWANRERQGKDLEGVMGKRIFVTLSGYPATRRKATIGGIVQSGSRCFYLTAGHAFDTPHPIPTEDDEESFEFDIGEESDPEAEDDFIDSTSKGSLTPEHTEYSSSDEFSVSVEDLTNLNMKSSGKSVSTEPAGDLNYSTDAADSGYGSEIPRGEISKEIRVGHLLRQGSKPDHPSLDYALIEITNTAFQQFALIGLRDEPSLKHLLAYRSVDIIPRNAPVVVVTGSGKVLEGIISGTPTYKNIPGSNKFHELRTVRLDGKLEEGDCGSWVVDAESGDLFGHIVAGSPESGVAYVIPAYEIFQDARDTFGLELHLPQKRRVHVEGDMQRVEASTSASSRTSSSLPPVSHNPPFASASSPHATIARDLPMEGRLDRRNSKRLKELLPWGRGPNRSGVDPKQAQRKDIGVENNNVAANVGYLTPPSSSSLPKAKGVKDFPTEEGQRRRQSQQPKPIVLPHRQHKKDRIIMADSPPTPRTPPQTFNASSTSAMFGPRGRPIIIDERPLRRIRSFDSRSGPTKSPRPASRSANQWDSPSSSHEFFDTRARREEELLRLEEQSRRAERDVAVLEAERRREERIWQQDEEIRRRPHVPLPPTLLRQRQSLRPAVGQSDALQGMMGSLDLNDRAGERALIAEREMRRRMEERDRALRARLVEEEEDAMRQRLQERQMPKRRFSVGPGNRRHRVLYDDGVYRWE